MRSSNRGEMVNAIIRAICIDCELHKTIAECHLSSLQTDAMTRVFVWPGGSGTGEISTPLWDSDSDSIIAQSRSVFLWLPLQAEDTALSLRDADDCG